MKTDMLIAQIVAKAPELPAHKISGYLLEFVDMLRTQGKEDTVTITTLSNQGHSALIPEKVIDVTGVYADGLPVREELTEDAAMLILHGYQDEYITDDNDVAIEDDNGIPLEV